MWTQMLNQWAKTLRILKIAHIGYVAEPNDHRETYLFKKNQQGHTTTLKMTPKLFPVEHYKEIFRLGIMVF